MNINSSSNSGAGKSTLAALEIQPTLGRNPQGFWAKAQKLSPERLSWIPVVRFLNPAEKPESYQDRRSVIDAQAAAMGDLLNLVNGLLPADLIACLRETAEAIVRHDFVIAAGDKVNGEADEGGAHAVYPLEAVFRDVKQLERDLERAGLIPVTTAGRKLYQDFPAAEVDVRDLARRVAALEERGLA